MYCALSPFYFIDFFRLKAPSKMLFNFILFFGLIFGQNRSDIQNTNHNKTKMVRNHYYSGALKEEGKKSGSLKIGPWTYWRENGEKYGLMIGWYENGKKSIQQNWKNARKNGSHLMWYLNGARKEEGLMSDGEEVGRWIYYTDDGNVDKILEHD